MVEPKSSRPYLLYVPSIYDSNRTWPLVVVCHGTIPYDTADRQMSEWAQFGEDKGIIILAPRLEAAQGDLPPAPPKQIALQQADEEAILEMVGATRNSYRVADEQIFMTGWSAAAYDILYTGLRNPDVFRALFIRQGTFDVRYLALSDRRVDRWQPIKIAYGQDDFLRKQALACIDWLRERGQYVDQLELTGSHRRTDPGEAWAFFRDIVRKRPWIRIDAVADSAQPLTMRFSVRSTPPARFVKWFFGDGSESYESSPAYTYASGGDYEITANVELKGGKKFQRRRFVRVVEPPPTP
jgi:predicted esterase